MSKKYTNLMINHGICCEWRRVGLHFCGARFHIYIELKNKYVKARANKKFFTARGLVRSHTSKSSMWGVKNRWTNNSSGDRVGQTECFNRKVTIGWKCFIFKMGLLLGIVFIVLHFHLFYTNSSQLSNLVWN